MMSEKNWEDLFQAFRDEAKFNEDGYADEGDFENLDLFEWFECGSYGPSGKMWKEINLHGYDVFCVERDSFGWLVGGVREKLVPHSKVITFG